MPNDKRDAPLPSDFPAGQPLPPFLSALRWCFRALASLQLAVVLIAVYIVVLAGATFVEKYQGADAARASVYATGWFAAIHIALAVNVLCAMLIRLPWRARQIGFLVTHGGILVLLAGCAMTRWFGVEAMLSIYEGRANHVALIDRQPGDAETRTGRPLPLGFQVYLHQFRRRLDPGSGTPSHYSSRVDFVELSDPPKPFKDETKLREDVLITLNAPVDFTDPQTGRTYRLFQSQFEGPWLPGDAEFDQLAGSDHSRDQIYLSRLSVNYDPGRWPKYIGSLMIVVGIAFVYYLRRGKPLAVSQMPPTGSFRSGLMLAIVAFLSAGGSVHAANEQLDWSTWQHLPVFSEGRVAPLDTFARETVRTICGRVTPTLNDPNAPPNNQPREFTAAELLFAWLAEPRKWEDVAFLSADEQLRRDLELPLTDSEGRRLRYVSPQFVENSDAIGGRWTDLMRRANARGKDFQMTDADKRLKCLVDAYGTYRALTLDPRRPHVALRRFRDRSRLAADALYKLIGRLQAAERISRDGETRKEMVQAGNAWQKLFKAMHAGDSTLEKMEPPVVTLRQLCNRLASRLASPNDAPLTAMAANLRHQAAQMQMALYDDGDTLRLLPALDAGALEESRTPDDDASPWLNFQALIYGSHDLLAAYPQQELKDVRKAYAAVKAAYFDRDAANRPATFAKAMNRFAESLRALAAKIEPLREQIPLRHRDQHLIDATAYPLSGSTDAEVFYNRLDPFFWSWVVSLAAVICLLLAVGPWQKPLFWLGAVVLVAGQSVAIAGMTFRGHITGLVPLTGMFETVEFVALYAGLLGLWFTLKPLWRWNLQPSGPSSRVDLVMQRRLFALAGAIVSFTAAVLAYYAPVTVMHRNIGSVTPILRDNFWLAVHVVTIMMSYASAAIALILGCIALGYYLFGRYRDENDGRRRPPEACGILAGFIYTAIQITVLLLAAGTILGAFWADKAWGHFWGWDPKEVWALVSLLVYLLILHLRQLIRHTRSLGWSGDFCMAAAGVFGFTAILFTWYFVNFVMGSGLHSYGSGSGGILAVSTAIASTWLFLLVAGLRHLMEIARHTPPALPCPAPPAANEETAQSGS